MRDDRPHVQLPPPEGSEDRPDGFISLAILALAVVGPLIYFGPQLRVVEAWLTDAYSVIDSWVAPVRELVFG